MCLLKYYYYMDDGFKGTLYLHIIQYLYKIELVVFTFCSQFRMHGMSLHLTFTGLCKDPFNWKHEATSKT